MIYNPLEEPITRTIKVPVYYTGIKDKVKVQEQKGKTKTYHIDKDYNIELTFSVPARGYNYFVMR